MEEDVPKKPDPPNPTERGTTGRKSLAVFLIESEIKPLVFVGRCAQYFGIGALAGFALGAASLYVYALLMPLPYAKSPAQPASQQPSQPKAIRLFGTAKGLEGEPLKEPFSVGVLESQHGPFESQTGAFTFEVPQRGLYDIVVWNADYEKVRVYGGLLAEPESGAYRLTPLPFPAGLGILVGNIKDENDDPFTGYVMVGDRRQRVVDGHFRMKDIPLGTTKIRILKSINAQPVLEREITLELTGETPFDFALTGQP